MKLVRLLVAAGLAALAATTVFAQATGGIRVRVVDASDKTPIIGAFVTLENSNHYIAKSTVVTDAQGVALFPVLKPGSGYKITVIVDGYATIQQDLETIKGGDVTSVPIAMAPAQTEVVKVVAKRQTVDLDKNESATKFNSEFIQDLPIQGRFYQNVLKLAPGVQDPNEDGNPNVNGARTRDFKTEVGGISNVDPLTGKYMNLVPSDSIEELSVITAGAGVEYGRAQGGYSTIVQKQGSNDFEGVVGMVYSSKILDGAGATGLSRNEIPDFYRYQPNLQVSGPLVRDKLWYRLTQEYIKREDPLVLGAGGNVATTGTDWFSTSNQLTWQVSNRNKLAFQYQADPRTISNFGLSALTPPSSTQKVQSGGPTYTLTWSAPYSPSLFIESIVGYQDTHFNFLPTSEGIKNTCIPGGSFIDGAECTDGATGQTSGSNYRTWKDNRQRLTVRSDGTYYKSRLWGMPHTFKFGFNVENERYFRSLLDRPYAVAFGASVSSQGGGAPGSVEQVILANFSLRPYSEQRAVGNTWAIYGSDVFRPLSNVSVTLGVRVTQQSISSNGYRPFDPAAESAAFLTEAANHPSDQLAGLLPQYFIAYEDIPGALNAVRSQVPGITLNEGGSSSQQTFWQLFRQPANINIHNTVLEPNIAVSWDPWNDGRSKFDFTARRYASQIFLGIPVRELEPVRASVLWTSSIVRGEGEANFSPTFSFSTVDRNLKIPYQDELQLAFQRELWQESSIKISLLRRSFKDQLQDIDINNAPGDYGKCYVQLKSSDPYLVDSPGTGPVTDPYTGEIYQDTDPGIGDGRTDDCTGKQIHAPVVETGGGGPADRGTAAYVNRPDGYSDLYVLNPGWGHIYQIGNYNSSLYNALIIEFTRRQYKNWQMEASYTLSKAVGDGEDYNQLLGDDRSTIRDEYGYQSYDVRHAVKVNATAITPWGFRLGGAVTWQSGLPYSIVRQQYSTSTAPPTYVSAQQQFTSLRTTYVTHQRNDQRNRSYWNIDAKLVKEMNLPKGINLQLTAEIFNLLNDDTYIIYNRFQELGWQVNGFNDAYRRFGRQFQLGVRLAF